MGFRTLRWFFNFLAFFGALLAFAQDSSLTAAKTAFDRGEFTKAISILEPEAAKNSSNGEVYLLLTKSYLQVNQVDAAIKSAEKTVSLDPKNSVYHDWLGQAYGEKASRASMFSAYPLARKTQKEFETAVSLNEHNFDATQNLIEYDCTAPGVVGGGEDKAKPLIQKLMSMDQSQGHYAQANCLLQKKNNAGATAEFLKALESKPRSMDLVNDIAIYFVNRGEADHLVAAASAGDVIAPMDPRIKFYRAVAWILKNEKPNDAEDILRHYLQGPPHGPDYPSASAAHYWIGRLYENQKNNLGARTEYETALKLNPKYKNAQDALKKLGSS
jgi:tetratricopeptide (TPR) repeat protein